MPDNDPMGILDAMSISTRMETVDELVEKERLKPANAGKSEIELIKIVFMKSAIYAHLKGSNAAQGS